jgi:hypothetical protein
MAEKTRKKRQSLTEKPFEEMDQAARAQSAGSGAEALKRAAVTAAAGAFAAGLAGATKALLERRDSQAEPETPDDAPEETEEPDGRVETPDPLDQAEEPAEDEAADEEEQQPSQPRAEASESDGEQPEGADSGEAAQIVRQARRELANLIGGEPESVSGLERANGNWTVTLEVVELRRVPESTDVLSSYEVVVDDERKLVSARRLRRYRRSQVEEM